MAEEQASSRSWQIPAAAGITYGVAWLAISIWFVSIEPSGGASLEEHREFLTDSDTALLTITFIELLLVGLVLPVFASGLRSFLAGSEPDMGLWSRVMLYGAATTTAVVMLGVVPYAAMAQGAIDTANDSTLEAVLQMDQAIGTSVFAAMGLMAFGGSMAIIRAGLLRQWIGWLGLGAAALTFIGAAWPLTGDPDGVLGTLGPTGGMLAMAWTLVVGFHLLRARDPITRSIPSLAKAEDDHTVSAR